MIRPLHAYERLRHRDLRGTVLDYLGGKILVYTREPSGSTYCIVREMPEAKALALLRGDITLREAALRGWFGEWNDQAALLGSPASPIMGNDTYEDTNKTAPNRPVA